MINVDALESHTANLRRLTRHTKGYCTTVAPNHDGPVPDHVRVAIKVTTCDPEMSVFVTGPDARHAVHPSAKLHLDDYYDYNEQRDLIGSPPVWVRPWGSRDQTMKRKFAAVRPARIAGR